MKQKKKELRKQISLRKKQGDVSWHDYSTQITRLLEENKLFGQARNILLYHSLPDEVNTHELIEKWYTRKRIILPVVKGEELELHTYHGAERCTTGEFGITEPECDPFTDYDAIDLAILPGVAFDRSGNRLGRGKGYYDRLLPQLSCPKIAVCYAFQLVEHVPAEEFDVVVDEVITEEGAIKCSPAIS